MRRFFQASDMNRIVLFACHFLENMALRLVQAILKAKMNVDELKRIINFFKYF